MMLLTKEIRKKLLQNGALSALRSNFDPEPVVKLFTPDGGATWLLTELDPNEPDRAFGLCDLGMGSPELGYVLISEIMKVRGKARLPVERDRFFTADRPISAYAKEARAAGMIQA